MSDIIIKIEKYNTTNQILTLAIDSIFKALKKETSCAIITKYVQYNLTKQVSKNWCCISGIRFAAEMNLSNNEFIKLCVNVTDKYNVRNSIQVFIFKSA